MKEKDFLLSSYDYFLEESLIAQEPSIPAHNAKLLVCEKHNGEYRYKDMIFSDIPEMIDQNTVLFFNSSKVYKARMKLENKTFILGASGKTVVTDGEIFVYKILSQDTFECLVADDKHYKSGTKIMIDDNIYLESIQLTPSGVLFKIVGDTIYSFLEGSGQMPLPPYVKYIKDKEIYYQTVFADKVGSVAAPTASLHFTKELLKNLENRSIKLEYETLHVGLGTFKPIYGEDITKHDIHEEEVVIKKDIFDKIANYKINNYNITPVGTTCTRLLESLPYVWIKIDKDGFSEETKDFRDQISNNLKSNNYINTQIVEDGDLYIFQTKLFIYPGFDLKIIDNMITNFHLPKSSLMLLVSGLMGRDNLLDAYEYAKHNGYKFYSFGDGMYIKNA